MAPHANDVNGEATGITVHAASPPTTGFKVSSANVTYGESAIESQYTYRTTDVSLTDGTYQATPRETVYDFKTERKVGKVGVMLVGWGGVCH